MATKKMGKGGPTNVEPKGFKPQVRLDLDKIGEATAIRDAAKRRYEGQKKTMEKKYPFNKYAEGGKVMKKADKAGRALVKKSADTMGRAMMKKASGGKCYAKGGSIDGVAKKGKTKGKMV